MKKLLEWIREIVLALLLVALILNIVSFIKRADLQSDTLPSFELMSIDKKRISSKDYISKPLLIHFWATWCPTCKLEASNIESTSKSYSVITIAVNSGSDEDIKRYMLKHDLHFDVVNDSNGEFASKFLVHSFPTTFIYDRYGKIKFSEVGYSSTIGLKLRMWIAD